MSKRQAAKFYAIALGRKPGIYTAWAGEEGAEAQVRGFPGARFHGFQTRREAEAWLSQPTRSKPARAPAKTLKESPARSQTPSPEPALTHRKQMTIYTDGACMTNPGPGGYAAILLEDGRRRELAGGFRFTTNNRMEIMAAIAGLGALKKPRSVTLYSDSKYLVDSMTKGWAKRWRENGWTRIDDAPVLNPDLWVQLLELCDRHQVTFKWVRGHDGNKENERCDELSTNMARQKDLPVDAEYEFGEFPGRAVSSRGRAGAG